MTPLLDKLLTLQERALQLLLQRSPESMANALLGGKSLAGTMVPELRSIFEQVRVVGSEATEILVEASPLPTAKFTAELGKRVARRAVKQAQVFVSNSLGQLFKGKQPAIDVLVREVTRGRMKPKALVSLLQGTKSQAKTLANTALGGVQRMAQHEVGHELSGGHETLFLYAGPEDAKTRGYCSALADKVVSLERLRRTPNGTGLPPHVHLGGYNCRHSLVPVSPRMVREMGLTLATSSDYDRARMEGRR